MTRLRQMRRGIDTVWDRLQVVRQFKGQLLIALGVGVVAGTAVYFGGPYVAAVAGWLGGFATTLAVQAGLVLQRMTTSGSEC